MRDKTNGYAMTIKFLAIGGGIIGSLIGFSSKNPILIALSIISAIFTCSLGEIIQLLEDIKWNTYKYDETDEIIQLLKDIKKTNKK